MKDLISDLENAAGHHYLHSSLETLARLEKARQKLIDTIEESIRLHKEKQ